MIPEEEKREDTPLFSHNNPILGLDGEIPLVVQPLFREACPIIAYRFLIFFPFSP
jgi:hypothetical protein